MNSSASSPAIAVVIPAYNAAKTLGDTIRSIQEQTIEEWEAVIVDDGSSDNTLDVARALATDEPRLQVLSQTNAGVSAARNAGIAATSAPIVGFLDADDRWLPTLASKVLAAFDAAPDAGVAFCRAEIHDADGQPTGVVSSFPDRPVDLELLVATNPARTCSTISARRTALKSTSGFAEDLRRCEDHHFLLAAFLEGAGVVGIDEALVAYRTSPDGLSANLEGMLDGWESMVTKLGPERLGPTLETARAEHLFYLARRALRLGRPRETVRYLASSFASDASVPFRKVAAAPITVARRAMNRSAS